MKKLGNSIFRLLVSCGAIALVFWSQRAHLTDALRILRTDIIWSYVFFAAATYTGALGIIALRLKLLFKVQKIRLTFRETFYLSLVGLFFNLFLPSAVGGDIIKVYYAAKRGGSKIHATTAVVWDRILGFSALLCMAMIGVALLYKELDDMRLDMLVVIFVVFFVLIGLFFMSKRFGRAFSFLKHLAPSEKIKKTLSSLYHSMHSFRSDKKILLQTLALSFAGQACFITLHYWLALGIGIEMNLWIFFILIPILSIVTMAPSLGGLGVREAALVYLFKHFIPNERALALSLLLDMLLYAFSFAAGILYAFKGGLKSETISEMEKMA